MRKLTIGSSQRLEQRASHLVWRKVKVGYARIVHPILERMALIVVAMSLIAGLFPASPVHAVDTPPVVAANFFDNAQNALTLIGPGASWDATTKTLTLTNVNFETTADFGFVLPPDAIIKLVGTNTLTVKKLAEPYYRSAAITSVSSTGSFFDTQNITFIGDGSLTITSNTKFGIDTAKVLTVKENATVTINHTSTYCFDTNLAYGVMAFQGAIVKNKARLNIESDCVGIYRVLVENHGAVASIKGKKYATTAFNEYYKAYEPIIRVSFWEDYGYQHDLFQARSVNGMFGGLWYLTNIHYIEVLPVKVVSVGSIVAPPAINAGEKLTLIAPVVEGVYPTKGWQMSPDGVSGWASTLLADRTLTTQEDGYYIRYFGSDPETTMVSNAVQISVKGKTTALSISAATSLTNPQKVVLTATLSGPDSLGSRLISFYSGTTFLGYGVTNTSGVATLTVDNPTAGDYVYHVVFDRDAYHEASSSSTITYTAKNPQAPVSFANSSLITKTYGDSAFMLPAVSGGSGTGALSYRSTNPNVVTVVGGVVTVVGAGSADIYVKRLGDANYNDSAEVKISIKVNPKYYNIWVGGIQVTNVNASGITGTGITGTITYDEETNTLTLNNAQITKTKTDDLGISSAIYATGQSYEATNLKIELIGTNKITFTPSSRKGAGIQNMSGDVSLFGSGSLEISLGGSTESSWGIYVNKTGKSLSISGTTVTVSTGATTSTQPYFAMSSGLYVNSGSLSITNATVTSIGNTSGSNNSYGIHASGTITLTNSTLVAAGYNNAISANTISATGMLFMGSTQISGADAVAVNLGQANSSTYKHMSVTTLTDAQIIALAKAAIVTGTVNVAYGATQTAKTAAVQTFVNSLMTGGAAGVTATVSWISGNDYRVALSKGSVTDSKDITMTVNVASNPDIAIVESAIGTAENANYTDLLQSAASSIEAIQTSLKNIVKAAINNSSITVVINQIDYVEPTAGTSSMPNGSNGGYTFTVTLSKGSVQQTTSELFIFIIATVYVAPDPNIALVSAAVTTAGNATYPNLTQAVATSDTYIGAVMKGVAELAVDNSEITVLINQYDYFAPTAGTLSNPNGINGTFRFAVRVSKGDVFQYTSTKTITIFATPYGDPDIASVSAAKAVVVGGTVNVAFGSDQAAKTSAVQSYVNALLTGEAAGVTATVTWISENNYRVALTKGVVSDTKVITMIINVAPNPDIAIVDSALTAAEKAIFGNLAQKTAISVEAIKAALKRIAEAAIDNDKVTVTINQVSYMAPILGTEIDPDGTNGTFVFTVTVIKGDVTQTTTEKTITIIARSYDDLNDPTIEIVHKGQDIATQAEGLENAVAFEDDERRQDIAIKLEISVLEENEIPVFDKSALDDYITSTLKVNKPSWLVLDISLFKVVGGERTTVTSTANQITVRFILPEAYRNADFHLTRVHNGTVDKLDYTYNEQTFEVSFMTDKFSTYGLAFDTSGKLPDTGDRGLSAGVLALLGFALLALSELVLKKKFTQH